MPADSPNQAVLLPNHKKCTAGPIGAVMVSSLIALPHALQNCPSDSLKCTQNNDTLCCDNGTTAVIGLVKIHFSLRLIIMSSAFPSSQAIPGKIASQCVISATNGFSAATNAAALIHIFKSTSPAPSIKKSGCNLGIRCDITMGILVRIPTGHTALCSNPDSWSETSSETSLGLIYLRLSTLLLA